MADRIYQAGKKNGNDDMMIESSKMYAQLSQKAKRYGEAVSWYQQYFKLAENKTDVDYKIHYRDIAECFEQFVTLTRFNHASCVSGVCGSLPCRSVFFGVTDAVCRRVRLSFS